MHGKCITSVVGKILLSLLLNSLSIKTQQALISRHVYMTVSLFPNTVESRSIVFQGSGENKRLIRKTTFFNIKGRTLCFASWQNFASVENITFRDLKCFHGPCQLHCAHRKMLQLFLIFLRPHLRV
jgi:hypothetical protein